MKNIVVVMTGGTIAMRIDPNLRAAIPSLSSEELIGEVKAHIKDTQIREKELFNIPSGHITPEPHDRDQTSCSRSSKRP